MHFKRHEKVLKEFFLALSINIKNRREECNQNKMRVSNKWAQAQVNVNGVVARQRHDSTNFKSLENGNYTYKVH